MIYGAISEEGQNQYTCPGRLFQALGNAQTDYNWLITALEGWPATAEDRQILLNQKYGWLTGTELTAIIEQDDFQWIWGVLSGFEKDVSLYEVLKYPLPKADGYEGFWHNPLSMQHPLATIGIAAFDSLAVLIFSRKGEITAMFKKAFPLSQDMVLYNQTQKPAETKSR